MLAYKRMTLAILLIFSLTACHRTGHGDIAWTMWVEDGKSGRMEIRYTPFFNFADSYLTTIQRMCDWNVVDYPGGTISSETRTQFMAPNLTVREIGQWGPYTVLDCTNMDIKHKGVVLRDGNGGHWILYLQFYWSTASPDFLPLLHEVAGQPVLSIRTRIPGTGNFYIEYHYIISRKTGLPQMVDISAIDHAIISAVPKGWNVWKGGGLEFERLIYSTPIWQPGDGNCCPTGGKIEMKLTLTDDIITVSQVRYDPTFDTGK